MTKTKTIKYKHILIIADIEGSSGCWSYEASKFMTREWAAACKMMSGDIDAVAKALFESGVESVTVKDFHRTGFNILPEMLDPRAKLVSGYIKGPVPGMGDPGGAEAAMFIGLHAASGTIGFLPHTLTSRIESIKMNGRVVTELELFASSLAPYGITPVFFSGCKAACAQARKAVKHITTHAIDKEKIEDYFDVDKWRKALAKKAVESVINSQCKLVIPEKLFKVVVKMRDGEKTAKKLSGRWGMHHEDGKIFFEAKNMYSVYMQLIRLCYLTPLVEKFLGASLFLYNLYGRMGRAYVRRVLK